MTEPTRPVVPRSLVLDAMSSFTAADTATGLRLFLVDYALLATGLGLALAGGHPALRLLGALLAGFKLGGLYTLSHDAAHNTLTASRGLNRVLGVLGFMPLLFNYRLWLHDHNATHHPNTNGPQDDAYKPMSPRQYRALPAWRRAWERFGRSAHPLSFAPYYAFGRYARAKVWPSAEYPARVRRAAWPYTLLLAAYAAAWLAVIAWHAGGDAAALVLDLLCVVVVPLATLHTLVGATLYFQHTHPEIPWFEADDPRRSAHAPESLTTRFMVPKLLNALGHYGFEHVAHHACAAIPCYRLAAAQGRLAEITGPSIAVPFTWGATREIARRCKLYDYERGCWVDFEGRPT